MMTDQPTTSEREEMAQGQSGAGVATDTRELRDAQAGGRNADRRPAIRAQGVPGKKTATTDKTATAASGETPLFDEAAGRELRKRWLNVQTAFVDEPREAVQKADALVAEVLQHVTNTFAREREELEGASAHGGEGSDGELTTEDLRLAIRRYRSFFNRLLNI
jgi:hypothetical protein